jgi:hypothetical protein
MLLLQASRHDFVAWESRYVGNLRAINAGLLDAYLLKSLDGFSITPTMDKYLMVSATFLPTLSFFYFSISPSSPILFSFLVSFFAPAHALVCSWWNWRPPLLSAHTSLICTLRMRQAGGSTPVRLGFGTTGLPGAPAMTSQRASRCGYNASNTAPAEAEAAADSRKSRKICLFRKSAARQLRVRFLLWFPTIDVFFLLVLSLVCNLV